jgi:hypothetical protein
MSLPVGGLRLACGLAFALLCAAPAAATPITLTFEHASADADYIPDGYGGLDWNQFIAFDVPTSGTPPGTGYGPGTISGTWVAFPFYGVPATISRSGGFNLYDGYFTAAWRDGLSVEAQAFRNGLMVYDKSWTLDHDAPSLLSFNFFDVDSVTFIATGGLNVVGGGDGTQFAMDDLRVEQTPIPAALPLFATALGGLAFAARRKRRPGALQCS